MPAVVQPRRHIISAKILLFYKFTPLADPDAIRLWQKTLCEDLGITGRILLSEHGINGTIGGSLKAVKRYIRVTREYPAFKDIDFKWSEGTGDDFPRLRVRVRDEIVTFGAPQELKVNDSGVIGGGEHLSPGDLHELVQQRGDDVVFFDGRNAFEARIGKFRNAIVPEVERTPDFISELESGKYDHLKDKPVVTYCTGGIRCEVLSVLMKNRGFREVYQLDGGIVRYCEKYKDTGLWEGSLYVFDRRLKMEFGRDHEILGRCDHCSTATEEFYNCEINSCRDRVLVCDDCAENLASIRCPRCMADEALNETLEATPRIELG